MVFGFLFKKKKKDAPQSKSEINIKPSGPQTGAQSAQSGSVIQNNPTMVAMKSGPPVSNNKGANQKPAGVINPGQKKPVDVDPDQWIYDYLLQYLTSPLWKIPIYSFIDDNCIVFDTEEENQFIYTEIHNKFKKMIEDSLECLLKELEITEEQFVKQLEKGVENETDKKIFEQLLIVDNFLVFKKLMLKRNKELELEAMRMLEEQLSKGSAGSSVSTNIRKMELEAEQAQIEHALAMSLAVEEERARMAAEEDELYQRALLESQLSYEEQVKKLDMIKSKELSDLEFAKKVALDDEQSRKSKEEQDKKKKEEQEKKKKEDMEKKSKEEQEKKSKDEQEKKKKEEQEQDLKKKEAKVVEIQEKPKEDIPKEKPKFTPKEVQEEEESKEPIEKKSSSNSSNLFASRPNVGMSESIDVDKKDLDETQKKPKRVVEGQNSLEPIQKKGSSIGLPPLKAENKLDPLSLNELLDKRKELQAKIDGIKQEDDKNIDQGESQESIMERKRRLQQQRDLILKKKKEERDTELKKYKEEQEKQGGAKGMIGKKFSMESSGTVFGMTVSTQDNEKAKKTNLMKKIKEGLEDDN